MNTSETNTMPSAKELLCGLAAGKKGHEDGVKNQTQVEAEHEAQNEAPHQKQAVVDTQPAESQAAQEQQANEQPPEQNGKEP